MNLIVNKKPFDHSSPSQVENYRTCPRKWYVEYILGMRSPSTHAQQLGTEVHSVLEAYLKTGAEPPNTAAGIIAKQGLHFLPKPGTVIVEGKVEIPGAPVKMIGVIDLLDPEGTATGNPSILTIGDHKTSADKKWMKSKAELAGDVQLTCYAHYGFSKRPDANIARVFHTYFGTKDAWSEQVSVMISRKKTEEQWADICGMIERMKADSVKEEDQVQQIPTSCSLYGGCHLKDRCWGAGKGQTITVPTGVPSEVAVALAAIPQPPVLVVQPQQVLAVPQIPTPPPAASLTVVETSKMPDMDDLIAGLGLKVAVDAPQAAAATAGATPPAPPAQTATAAAVAALVTPAAQQPAPVVQAAAQAAHVQDVLAGLGMLPGRDGVNPPEPVVERTTDVGLELGGPNGTIKKKRRTKAEIEAEKAAKVAAEVAAAVAAGITLPAPVVAQVPQAPVASNTSVSADDVVAALMSGTSAPVPVQPVVPVQPPAPAPATRPNGRVRMLLVGSWPTKGMGCVDFGVWVGPLQAAVAAQAKVSHVSAIDFGKGYAAVAVQLAHMGWPEDVDVFYIDPMGVSKACVEILSQFADVVIHKL